MPSKPKKAYTFLPVMSELEEKPRRSMPSKPKKVIFASTDIRYRDTEKECSGVQKVEVKYENEGHEQRRPYLREKRR